MGSVVRFAYTVIAAAALAGCGEEQPLGPADPAEVAAARARWTALGVRNYEYISAHACFCPSEFVGPLRTVVENGAVVRVEDATTGESRPLSYRPTIDGWFDFMDQELNERPDDLQVTFDPVTGIPRRLVWGTPATDGGGIVGFRRFRTLGP